MNKKIFLLLMALTMSVSSFAQFEKGKKYLSATMSGLNLQYSGFEKWKFDIGARAGYMIVDNWMLMGTANYTYQKNGFKAVTVGAGARYYIIENGLYLGLAANYQYRDLGVTTYHDFVPNLHIGYAFFVSRTVTIEPELYYNQSLKDHSNYSEVGFRIGVGIYLDKLIP